MVLDLVATARFQSCCCWHPLELKKGAQLCIDIPDEGKNIAAKLIKEAR